MVDIDGLVQDCSISTANALEILQSCTKPSIYIWPSWFILYCKFYQKSPISTVIHYVLLIYIHSDNTQHVIYMYYGYKTVSFNFTLQSSLCKLIWRHWTYKVPVRYILSSVWVRLSIFSQLSIIQYMGLHVLSLPFSLVMIERIYMYILCLIIIIKSDVWTIIHCLWLGHETMVCAVCVPLYFYKWSLKRGHFHSNLYRDRHTVFSVVWWVINA